MAIDVVSSGARAGTVSSDAMSGDGEARRSRNARSCHARTTAAPTGNASQQMLLRHARKRCPEKFETFIFNSILNRNTWLQATFSRSSEASCGDLQLVPRHV